MDSILNGPFYGVNYIHIYQYMLIRITGKAYVKGLDEICAKKNKKTASGITGNRVVAAFLGRAFLGME